MKPISIITSVAAMLGVALSMPSSALASQRLRPVPVDDINFPDEVFRNFVSEVYDENKDGQLTAQEIYHAKTMVSAQLAEVSSFEGIDNLIALETIECRGNYFVTKLDFSGMAHLKSVVCNDNFYLSSIDLSGCSSLERIECSGNDHLASVDLANLPSLKKLSIIRSALHELDLTQCAALEYANCSSNEALRSLDVSGLTSLKSLKCCKQPVFTSVNVKGCDSLEKIICFENKNLTSIEVSGLGRLIKLDCSRNNLTAVNVSGCSSLEALDCYGNAQLKTMNVSGLKQLRKLNCSNCSVSSLKLDGCPMLEVLDCYNLKMQFLDLTTVPTLRDLSCSSSDYSKKLVIKGYEKLERIACKGDVDVDFAKMPNLRDLYCGLIGVQSLDVRKCTSLEQLDCSDNVGIKSINANNLQSLKKLICYNSAVGKIDVENCQALKMIFCYGCPNLQELDVPLLKNLTKVVCSNCNITRMNLFDDSELVVLNAGHNHLGSLDLSTCTKLKTVEIAGQTRHLKKAKANKRQLTIPIENFGSQKVTGVKINEAEAKYEVVQKGQDADLKVSRSKYTDDKDDVVAYTIFTGRPDINMIVEVKIDKLEE